MSTTFYNYKAFFKNNALLIFPEKAECTKELFQNRKIFTVFLFGYDGIRQDRFFIAI